MIKTGLMRHEGRARRGADMRNNPGGLLRAGLDVARLWLDGEAAVFNVQGRDEDGRMAVTQVLGRQMVIWWHTFTVTSPSP